MSAEQVHEGESKQMGGGGCGKQEGEKREESNQRGLVLSHGNVNMCGRRKETQKGDSCYTS